MSNQQKSKRVGVKYFLFFILIFSLTVGLSANFSKNGDIVTDSKTGLQWQDNNDTNGTLRTWQESIDYCEALNSNSHSDWRLPNINELKTIIDRSKILPAIVNEFEYVKTNNIAYPLWSSSTVKGRENHAWAVRFGNGLVGEDGKDGSFYVRCVRNSTSSQNEEQECVDGGGFWDGTECQ